ncbi:class I SAM-dependent DNA methyltransferase [Aestuariibaculum lutulentum]|uniref:Class I SAM-dependent methyltransferase n=1 Tax=Aestuariibaculum lutulentum TaxID=2920935 RepID=A0ABS9REK3_9FLAO|nr:class I SAM-dependent methyltransferase [Aestuariibaculum lutulentum]MCH4551383.1 class I SAM-dependent methyltransferase [Aestuariibaculum lutulentum]
MNKYQETFNTWNSIANRYEEAFFDLHLYNDTYDFFLDNLPDKESKILDVGCGPGNITNYLLNKSPNLKIKGIDISKNMIALAQKNNKSAEFKIMDIRNLDSLQDSFDGIICGFCLPYLSKKDYSKLISDCNLLLNKNGILYLSFVEGDTKNSGYISGSTGDRMYFYYHNLKDLKNELTIHGFESPKLILKSYAKRNGSEETHSILISRKK